METRTREGCWGKGRAHKPATMKKAVFGLLVIASGVFLLGFNFDFLPIAWKPIVFSWQMLLIAIGFINIFGRESRLLGLVLILAGGVFIAPLLYSFEFNFVKLFWPLLLIVIGVLIITKWIGGRFHFAGGSVETKDGFIEETNIFSGSKKRFTGSEFKGGKISNIFGGTELDLSQATLPEGKTVLEVNCVFGGVTLLVPASWIVQTEMASIFGGFADKRAVVKHEEGPKRILVIKGAAIFGGGEIKSF